jgi:hypothetical protein
MLSGAQMHGSIEYFDPTQASDSHAEGATFALLACDQLHTALSGMRISFAA